MSITKIFIVDDHWVAIEGIKSAVRNDPGLVVVGEAYNGLQAINQVGILNPDIIIMDISMPLMNGLETARRIRRLYPDIRIVIFTMYSNKEYLKDLKQTGISAYILKDDPLSELVLAINLSKAGGTYFSEQLPVVTLEKAHVRSDECIDELDVLSMREREVFRYLAEGEAIKDIAARLHISPKTVESHKYHIMEKLGVRLLAELTKIAIKKKLIRL